jgi:hypothetical protein
MLPRHSIWYHSNRLDLLFRLPPLPPHHCHSPSPRAASEDLVLSFYPPDLPTDAQLFLVGASSALFLFTAGFGGGDVRGSGGGIARGCGLTGGSGWVVVVAVERGDQCGHFDT